MRVTYLVAGRRFDIPALLAKDVNSN